MIKKIYKDLNQDDTLIEGLRKSLASGDINVGNLYVMLNNGKISLLEYLRSTDNVDKK